MLKLDRHMKYVLCLIWTAAGGDIKDAKEWACIHTQMYLIISSFHEIE
jgi:hypothetical protein